MDNEPEKIAVASSDGIFVNQHFGHAAKFYIFEVACDEFELLETRIVEPACQGRDHDEKKICKNMDAISDCDYLLVSKIGYGAAAIAEQKGIIPYEIPGVIEESIQQLLNYIKIKKLFE